MSQYSRISQLQQRITELRIRGLEDRVEIRQLRNLVSEQKTALEAAQLEIEVLREQLSGKQKQVYREPAECSDYRQYESLAVQEAFGRGMARYAGAMQKLAEND